MDNALKAHEGATSKQVWLPQRWSLTYSTSYRKVSRCHAFKLILRLTQSRKALCVEEQRILISHRTRCTNKPGTTMHAFALVHKSAGTTNTILVARYVGTCPKSNRSRFRGDG